MIFETRYKQCEQCQMNVMCRYKEIYYQNKGEWPVESMADRNGECKYAPFKKY